jgi:hypothetical protein
MVTTAKDCHALTTYYEKKFKEKYHSAAVVNRNTARWGFDAILKGISPEETKELLDYWFNISSPQRHPLQWFFYNYDKLITAKAEQSEDDALRAKLRHDSEERVRKWRERRAGRSE